MTTEIKPVHTVTVPSDTGSGEYTVSKWPDGGWTCTCKFYEFRQVDCKHIKKVKAEIEADVENDDGADEKEEGNAS